MNRLRRLILPAVAAVLALVALTDPKIGVTRDLRDVLLVVDVTRSMNVRDMGGQSRLDYTRRAIGDWLARQPCGTRAGLAIFSERRSLTLFEPVEICAEFAAISGTLATLNWRMAWEGDSLISKGLNHALTRAAGLDVALVFVTDGQEAPPLPYIGADAFRGTSPGGVVLGAGGDTPAPIPMFDDLGRESGFYGPDDVQHAPSRIGAPPANNADRPGFHPRNNPYGESDLQGAEHLSSMRGEYLRNLAAERSLGFARISDGPAAIDAALAQHSTARAAETQRGFAPVFGLAALLVLVAAWARPSRHSDMSREEKLT